MQIGIPPTGPNLTLYGAGKVVTNCWFEPDGTLSTTVSNAGFLSNFSAPPLNGAPGGYIGPVTGATVSIACPNGAIIASGYYASSDRRLKDDIRPVADDLALHFVREVQPVSYVKDGRYETGFVAQDVAKLGYNHLVSCGPSSKPEIAEEEIDEDGFVSPAGHQFTMEYQQILAYHQKALKTAFEQIDALRAEIAALRT